MKINFLSTAILISFSLTLLVSAEAWASPQSGSQSGSASKPPQQRGSATKNPQRGSGTKSPQGSGAKPAGSGAKSGSATKPAEETAEAKEFRELQQRLRDNQTRIDYLFRTIPIGFPEKRKQHKDEIARLTALNEQLETEVFAKAKAAFRTSEIPSALSGVILQKRLNSMLRPRNPEEQFNPEAALELITLMQEKFPDSVKLFELEFIANYAIERFENAERALVELEKRIGAELKEPKAQLLETKRKYQQELLIRRMEANTNDLPEVLLVTSEGDIKVQLFENHAPNTVANFIHLVRDQKFYDGKLFHLVKPGEYAVTGSPNGDGMGDAGYRIPCECDGEKIRNHFRGTLSMMAPSKDRGGSQFFITQQPNPHTYDGKYTAFGRVVEGMDVVLKLKTIDRTAGIASASNASRIVRAEVTRARSHSYLPEKSSTTGSSSRGSGSKAGSGSQAAAGSGSNDAAAAGSDNKQAGSDTKEAGSDAKQAGSDTKQTGTDTKQAGSNSKDPAGSGTAPEDDGLEAAGSFDLLLQDDK